MDKLTHNGKGSSSHSGTALLKDVGFTVLHPFYNERERFDLQLANWLTWSDEVKSKVQIVLIDDCSPSPVHEWFTPSIQKRLGNLNIVVYRITTDLKWNTPGALNLGFTAAPTPWVLTMDSDCAFDAENIEKFLDADPREDSYYKFPRQRYGDSSVENLEIVKPLPCSLLVHKNMFWHVGGFDEDFTGEYTGGYALFDTYFHHRSCELGYIWYSWNEVTAMEWMPSVASRERPPENRNHYKINKKVMYAKQASDLPVKSRNLRFDWERTFRHTGG
jgi:glycosyltransferase involved in cell wall biosynthesis